MHLEFLLQFHKKAKSPGEVLQLSSCDAHKQLEVVVVAVTAAAGTAAVTAAGTVAAVVAVAGIVVAVRIGHTYSADCF